jgi:hypothetical protein
MRIRRCLTCGAPIARAPYGSKDLLLYCDRSCAASGTNRYRTYVPGTKLLACAELGCEVKVLVHAHAASARCAPHRHAHLLARKRKNGAAKRAARRATLSPTKV